MSRLEVERDQFRRYQLSAHRPVISADMERAVGAPDQETNVVDFAHIFDRVHAECESIAKRRAQMRRLGPRHSILSRKRPHEASVRLKGDETLATLRSAIDRGGIKPSKTQRLMIDAMIGCTLRLIYKEEFDENRDMLLKRFGIKHYVNAALIRTARQWGKTRATALFVAACAYALDSIEVAVISPVLQQSRSFGQTVRKSYLSIVDGREDFLEADSKDYLFVFASEEKRSLRRINYYPARQVRRRTATPCSRASR